MKSLDEHNREARKRRMDMNKPYKNGIACPSCGEELYDSEPGMTLLSDPPQHKVRCEGCGYTGTRL